MSCVSLCIDVVMSRGVVRCCDCVVFRAAMRGVGVVMFVVCGLIVVVFRDRACS